MLSLACVLSTCAGSQLAVGAWFMVWLCVLFCQSIFIPIRECFDSYGFVVYFEVADVL